MTKPVTELLRELAQAVIDEDRKCVGPEGPSSGLVHQAEAALASLQAEPRADLRRHEVLWGPASSDPYAQLLLAVERAWPGETRHETALRYIRETEARANEPGEAKQENRTGDA